MRAAAHPSGRIIRMLTFPLLCALLALPGCGTGAARQNGPAGGSTASPVVSPAQSGAGEASSDPSAAGSQAAVSSAAPASRASPVSSAPSAFPAAGHIVCLDPGHQKKVDLSTEPEAPGSSVMKVKNPGGTEGVSTRIPEYRLNMEVADKLRQVLEAEGVRVVMTRTDDSADIGNIQRAQAANACGAEIFLRIHADSADSPDVKGATMLIPGDGFIHDTALLAESRKVGQYLLDSYIAATGAKSRGFSVRSDMTGFNWCTRPMVLLEMGFMSNPDEDRLLNSDAYQEKIVDGLADGINRYFAAKAAGK